MSSSQIPEAARGDARGRGPAWGNRIRTLVLVAGGLFWLTVALRAVTPLVLADEYVYLVRGVALDGLRRLDVIAPSVPHVGNYLFLRVINMISRTRLPLDVTMKVINVACLVVALHLIGRLVVAKDATWRSTALFVVVVLLPVGSYVAYVMPESLYLMIFIGLFVILVRAPDGRLQGLWAMAGVLIAALSLVKAHGLFVLAAFLGATLAWSIVTGRVSFARALTLIMTAIAAFAVATVLGLALVAPREAGGDFVGNYYWSMVGRAAPTWSRIWTVAQLAMTQTGAILLLLAPSLTFLTAGVFAERRRSGSVERPGNLMSFTGLFLILLIGLIVLAVSFVLSAEPNRIQLRYLNFTFPCVLTLAWIWARANPSLDSRNFRLWAAAIWVLGAGYYLVRLPALWPLPADAPELFFTYHSGEFGAFGLGSTVWFVTAAVIALCALAMLHPKVRWFDAQLLALLILVPIADFDTIHWQDSWTALQAPLRAIGDVAKARCGRREADIVAFLPFDDPGRLYTALTRVGRAIPVKFDPKGGLASLGLAPGGCVITSLGLSPALGPPLAQHEELALYRSAARWLVVRNIAFDHGGAPALLGKGWSQPETGGVWTDGAHAVLHLGPDVGLTAEPEVVEINAFAFEPPPSKGQHVALSMNGRPLGTWLVHDGSYQVRLPASSPTAGSLDLELSLPDAEAPASVISGAADRRLLGIAVRRVTILRQAPSD